MKLLQRDETDESHCCLWIEKVQSATALQHHVHDGDSTKQSMPRDEMRLAIRPLVVVDNDKTCNKLLLHDSSQQH